MDIGELCIHERDTIIEAMARLDYVAKKILFVVENEVLLATLTDGDIRRWILSKGDLNAEVKKVANYNPLYLHIDKKKSARQFMIKHCIEALPIVDEHCKLNSVILRDDKEILRPIEPLGVPVVIMAGGLGTRLYPYTKILPKPLIPVGDIPMIEHIVNQFNEAGCTDFHFILNYKGNMIKAYFNEVRRPYHINYVDENTPLGTGGGLYLLKGIIYETFILSNCDTLILSDYHKIMDFHKKDHNFITMICSLKNYTIPFGVVKLGENGKLLELDEKPHLPFIINTGCYIVEPDVIEDLSGGINIGFTDIIEKYRKQGKKIGIYPISETSWTDMGQMDGLNKMIDVTGGE